MNKRNVVDIFCGCGGFSLGFELASFNIVLGIDNWKDALDTFSHNHPQSKTILEDIRDIDGNRIRELVGTNIDIVIGGPPCQGFSFAGSRNIMDDRNSLVDDFIRIVLDINPKFFVMENVVGILPMTNKDGIKMTKYLQNKFSEGGYSLVYKKLMASNYGVPQNRERVFFVGNRLGIDFRFPSEFPNKITTFEAISDLPSLETSLGQEKQEYTKKATSDYQRWARLDSSVLFNHVAANHTEKTKSIISLVPDGGIKKNLPIGIQSTIKFRDSFHRLAKDGQSMTIDTGHGHHFHYKYNRGITVRESARLQSFPDKFFFCGTKTSQLKQVGNAVPPLLSKAIAQEIYTLLDRKEVNNE